MISFWLELKSVCKSYKFLTLIIILLAFQLVFITQFQNEAVTAEAETIASNNGRIGFHEDYLGYYESEYRRAVESTPWWFTGDDIAVFPKWIAFTQYQLDLSQRSAAAYLNKDWSTYVRLRAEESLLIWMYQCRGPITPEQFFGEDWEKFKPLVELPGLAVEHYFQFVDFEPQWDIWEATYYLHLVKEDLPPAGPTDTSPWAFTFNFMHRGLPSILGLIVLLMTVNLLHRDRKSGAVKFALVVPRRRSYYLLRKTALGFISSIVIVLMSQLLIFLALGLKHGFRGMNYPVLVDNGFMNLSFTPGQLSAVKTFYNYTDFGFSRFPSAHSVRLVLETIERLDVIKAWQFFGIAFVLLAMFILFCSVVGIFISILVKNEILAQVVAVGVFALGTAFGRVFPSLKTTVWDLFSKADVIPLLEGSHYSTYLGSLTVLAIATILLLVIGGLIFRKQNIVSN